MKYPKIIIPIEIVDELGSVYKVTYAEKYIIVMAKSAYRSIASINNDIERYHKGVREGTGLNDLYRRFCLHIVDNPGHKFSMELILATENPYQLLKCCQIELDKAHNDANCRNSTFEPYINKDIQKPLKNRRSVWWINRGAYLNFIRWQRKRHFKPI